MDSDKKSIRLFLSYVLPAMTALLMAALYGIVDTIFIARNTGITGVAGVGLVTPFMMLLIAVCQTIGTGGSVIISFRRRDNNPRPAYPVGNASLILSALSCAGLIVLFLMLKEHAFEALGGGPLEKDQARKYLFLLLPGMIPFGTTMVMENISRGMGRNDIAFKSMMLGGILNTLLDYLLIVRLPLGVSGAALATSASQTVCFLFNLVQLKKIKGVSSKEREIFSFTEIWQFGIPVFIHQVSVFAGLACLLLYVKPDTSPSMIAGVSLFHRILFLIMLLHLGVLQGMQPLAGYLKANHKERQLNRILGYSLLSSYIISIFSFLFILIKSKSILGLFFPHYIELDYLAHQFTIASGSMMFWPIYMIAGGFFLSQKKPFLASIVNASRNMVFLLPSIAVTGLFFTRFESLWIGSIIADALNVLLALALYQGMKRRKEQDIVAC